MACFIKVLRSPEQPASQNDVTAPVLRGATAQQVAATGTITSFAPKTTAFHSGTDEAPSTTVANRHPNKPVATRTALGQLRCGRNPHVYLTQGDGTRAGLPLTKRMPSKAATVAAAAVTN